MNDPLAAAKVKAEKAYNAAAESFDAEPLAFWARYGRRTVERLSLRRGAHVLDVCCGTGASASPAAQVVGPEGKVIAVDLRTSCSSSDRPRPRAQDCSVWNFAEET